MSSTPQKKNRCRKNGDKDEKELYRLMNNAVYEKTMKNRRNRIVVKLKSNEKDYMNWTSKPSYMSQKIFDNDLVAMHRSKVRSTHNKSVYVGILAIILLSQNMIIQANRWLVKWKMNMWIRYYRICWIKAKDVLSLVRWR